MSKFITGKELGEAIYNIIWEAENDLLVVSPYIKLDDYFKRLFNKHLTNPNIQITIVFGKNEGQVNKSFNKDDLTYFKQFLNVSIIYAPKLHAKYYANEYMGIITSINLYDYSFINNIEFGVLYENKLLNRLSKNTDDNVWEACMDIAEANEVVYIKRPVFQKKFFSKNYMSSKILVDRTEDFYNGQSTNKSMLKLADFDDELDYDTEYTERPTREAVERPKREEVAKPTQPAREATEIRPRIVIDGIKQQVAQPGMGYCIRTRTIIPFNPGKPLCYQAQQSWNQFGNDNYPEKFCHYSGEPSNGETSVKRPILYKNWREAQRKHQL